ncbi:Try-1 [Aphelenchoides bicaudatus]|nr:Try-1 [Aphelenchoides bicaudatus]
MLRCFILSLLFLTNNFQLLLGDSSDPVEKILGNKAAPYSRPWMGQLFYSGRFTCGCSLISNQYALTAAHCVRNDDGRALQRYHIVFGGHSLKSGTSVGIKKIIKHPKYDDVAYYNAALLLLDEIVHETDKISIIRLAEKSPNVNDKCIVNGWGITDKTKLPSKVLKEINVNVTSPRICSDKNSILFDNNTMICVSESKNAGTCSGDDGGPLVCSNNTCFFLFLLFFTNSVQIFVGDDPVADHNFKILGGKEAIPHSRPWIGQLFYNGRFRCGCSLISSKYALTAAHCVRDDLDERNYHVVLGGHRLKSGISVGIREITEHPQYGDVKPRYDAALLLFNENVSETDRISTIRLSERSPFANETCIVNGWGSVKYHGSPASNVLMEAKVNIFSPHNCKNSSAFDKNTMICVNESKLAGSCSGDSGGPMLCSNDNEYSEQHGIVSFGLTTSYSSEDDSKSDEGPVLKILGGHEAAPYSRPWIGQLFYNGGFTCGCSLISNQYALTAAHCVRDDDKKALKRYHIVFGGHSLNSGTSIGIKQIIKHSQYDNIAHYDAALLLFNGTISETDKISIIRLAEKSPDVDDKCIVNGWGSVKYHGSPASNVLKEINVNVLSPRVCSNKNSVIFDKNTMICVNEYAGSCSGDSGGPLLCSNNK